MKKFDIDKIGRKMPYSAPPEEFFENFKTKMELMSSEEMAQQSSECPKGARRVLYSKRLISFVAAAATLLVGLFIAERIDYREERSKMQYAISESIDSSIDSYFDNLSDEELAYLVDSNYAQDDFFLTLPNNE